jgi:cyclophilin family peptidyl-prolyl cis-trans isomerase
MKRVFTRQTKPLTLMLAVSIALGASAGIAHAKSVWNPMSWFSGSTASQEEVEQAQKKADEAQQAADQALLDAQKAMHKAEEAKRDAEILQQKAVQKPDDSTQNPATEAHTTPTASPANPASNDATTDPAKANDASTQDQQAEAPQTTNTQPEPTQTLNTSSTPNFTTVKSEPWNPLTWFKKSPDGATQNAPQDTSEPKSDSNTDTTTDITGNQAAESATSDNSSNAKTDSPKSKGWNWFPKLAPQAASTEQQPAKETAEQQPATNTDGALDPAIKTKAALIETEKGNIAIELYPDQAPQTVANFVSLINQGFYNRFNMKFHRVVPGFVVQTGDPTGTGAGGSKKTVPLEAKNKLSHNAKGIVAMARGADPNSATSQFYITLAPQTSLDGKYAIFGKVISGIDVLDKIEKDDMMYGIRLVELSSVVRDPAPEKKKFFSSLF